MPRPRIHKNNAEKQRAYRARKRRSTPSPNTPPTSKIIRAQRAGEQAMETFFGNRVR